MTLSEIRVELLGQHALLRSYIAELRLLGERVPQGTKIDESLRAALEGLAIVLRQHAAREEELLRDIIPTIDAWGPARAEIMDDTHRHEHTDLEDAIRSPNLASVHVVELFDRILEHMEREEASFLGEDVLKDDAVLVEFGGQ